MSPYHSSAVRPLPHCRLPAPHLTTNSPALTLHPPLSPVQVPLKGEEARQFEDGVEGLAGQLVAPVPGGGEPAVHAGAGVEVVDPACARLCRCVFRGRWVQFATRRRRGEEAGSSEPHPQATTKAGLAAAAADLRTTPVEGVAEEVVQDVLLQLLQPAEGALDEVAHLDSLECLCRYTV